MLRKELEADLLIGTVRKILRLTTTSVRFFTEAGRLLVDLSFCKRPTTAAFVDGYRTP